MQFSNEFRPYTLREIQQGQMPYAEDWNQLVRTVKWLFERQDRVDWPQEKARPSLIATAHADIGVDVPPYSVFGVARKDARTSPQEVYVERVGTDWDCNGSPLRLFTNGPDIIKDGRKGLVWPIGDYEPVRLKYDVSAPKVGWPCGVAPDSFEISALGAGFVCLSEPDDDDTVNVMAVSSGTLLMVTFGAISARVAPLGDSGTSGASAQGDSLAYGTLGTGTANVVLRHASALGAIRAASDPETRTTPWTLPVWNPGAAIASNKLVIVAPIVGVGLVIVQAVGAGTVDLCDAIWDTMDVAGTPDSYVALEGGCLVKAPVPLAEDACAPFWGTIPAADAYATGSGFLTVYDECLKIMPPPPSTLDVCDADLGDMAVADTADGGYIVGYQDGCLVLFPFTDCDPA